jgi:hypothetical protein
MDKKIIFQVDSKEVIETLKFDNYCIEYNDKLNFIDNNLCVIYFSSNEIYYPNTSESFNYFIKTRDKFEWKQNKFPNARKHIFLRDLQKQWYLCGINNTLNNPIQLLNFLRMETYGYRIIAIGSSAGGFAALLFGSLLNCERVYAFNAQLNLNITMNNSNLYIDPILFAKKNDPIFNIYYNLSNILNDKTSYYYFQSFYSKIDVEQFNGITLEAQKKLKTIRFKTSNHGFPFLRFNLLKVLQFSNIKLNQYVDKIIHPIFFSIQLIGLFPTIFYLFKTLITRLKKKKLEYILNKSYTK